MRAASLWLLILPAAGGAGAWWLLTRTDPSVAPPAPAPLRSPAPVPGRVEAPLTAARPPEEGAVQDPAPRDPEDPSWPARNLPLPPGTGSLKGSELIAAIAAGGLVRLEGATPADLEALRAARFDDVDRDLAHPYAAALGWLKDAGFDVEVAYPVLVVRRRAEPEDGR